MTMLRLARVWFFLSAMSVLAIPHESREVCGLGGIIECLFLFWCIAVLR